MTLTTLFNVPQVAFVELLEELHDQFSARKLILTAAVSVGLDKIEAGYNVPELMK